MRTVAAGRRIIAEKKRLSEVNNRERITIKMKDTPIVLSISMLISGREEMKKSLDSLHYFTEAFPCEIILVDTGCNPEQRALAEQYADKIVNFTWCNDFAAARNAGLKEARGEWFMYLDDDEWFDDPQQIVSFFTSGEYKNYYCASYVQRNYSDFQGAQYEDAYPSRMIRLEPETIFFGKVHECLSPYKLPKKEFSDFVHHYGYVFEGEEDKKKHALRNIAPLLELRKEQPGEPRWMCQLAQEYYMLSEYGETVRVCKEGLAEWERVRQESGLVYAPSHVGALYAYLLVAMENLKRYEEEAEWLEKALAEPDMKLTFTEPNLAFFCLVGARLYNCLKDYDRSRNYFRRYIDYTKRLRGERALLEAGTALIVAGVFQEVLLYGTVLFCMESAIRVEDHALAEEAFYMLDWQDWRLLCQNEQEKKMLDAACSVAYHPIWVKILQTLVSRPEGMKEMLVVLLETEIMYKRQGDAGKEKLSRLHRLVAELSYEHRYVLYAKILWAEENPEIASDEDRRQEIEALFGELVEKYQDEILEVKAEIWSVAMHCGISLEALLSKIDYRRWKQMLEQWQRTAELWAVRQWSDLLAEWKQASVYCDAGDMKREEHPLYCDLLVVKCREGMLRRYQEAAGQGNSIELTQLEQALWRYADSVLALYQPYFETFVFDEVPEILPEEAQLALCLKRQQICREEGNDLRILESVRACLGICPALEDIIGDFAKMVRDEIQRRDREADEAQGELRRLIGTLKKAARMQIESGGYQAAKEILLQIQQCAPEDEEVRELLQKLSET